MWTIKLLKNTSCIQDPLKYLFALFRRNSNGLETREKGVKNVQN